MLTSELYRRAADLRSVLASNVGFFDGLEVLAAQQAKVESFIDGVSTDDDANGHAQGLVKHLRGLRGSISGLNVRSFFSAAERVEAGLLRFAEGENPELGSTYVLVEKVKGLSETLNDYLSQSKTTTARKLLRDASAVKIELQALDMHLTQLAADIGVQEQLREGEQIINLRFDQSMNLDELVERLSALQELIEILQTHVINAPPSSPNEEVSWVEARVLRIESGSTEIIVAVINVVGNVLVPLLIAGGVLWYKLRTKDGNLKHQIPAEQAVLKSMVEIVALLPKDHPLTDEMTERLLRVSDKALTHLEKVVDAPHGVRVNNNRYDEQRYDFAPRLEGNALPRLPGKAEDPPPQA